MDAANDDQELEEWFDAFSKEVDGAEQFLLFTVGGTYFATPLLSVQEVLEEISPTTIPNTVPHFRGVFNLRGEVVGTVDLRDKFEVDDSSAESEAKYLIFKTANGVFAAVVDQVSAVIYVAADLLDKDPAIKIKAPKKFLIGVAKLGEQMVTVIDLAALLTEEDVIALKNFKAA